jgi:hypothetical protein
MYTILSFSISTIKAALNKFLTNYKEIYSLNFDNVLFYFMKSIIKLLSLGVRS